MDIQTQIEKLTAAGYQAKDWQGKRVYVRDTKGQDMGYLVPGDDGSTGTCKNITRRAGSIKSALRA